MQPGTPAAQPSWDTKKVGEALPCVLMVCFLDRVRGILETQLITSTQTGRPTHPPSRYPVPFHAEDSCHQNSEWERIGPVSSQEGPTQ